jgi:hypothetical protein
MTFIQELGRSTDRHNRRVRQGLRELQDKHSEEEATFNEIIYAAGQAFRALDYAAKEIQGNKKALAFLKRHRYYLSPENCGLHLFTTEEEEFKRGEGEEDENLFCGNEFYVGLVLNQGEKVVRAACGNDDLNPCTSTAAIADIAVRLHEGRISARKIFMDTVRDYTKISRTERELYFFRRITPDEVTARLERLAKTEQ